MIFAAAGKFFLNWGAIASKRNDLNQNINELRSLNDRLDKLIAQIEDSWQGDSSVAYVNKMRQYAEKGRQIEQVLEEFDKYSESTVKLFQTTDQDCASAINNSF